MFRGRLFQTAERHLEFEYHVMKGNRIPYPSAIFDIVTATNVLHHIDLEAWQSVVLELKRLVRPDGLVCIMAYVPLDPLTRLVVLRYPFDKHA
jgi:2-polyprenyl-3-methyl-5-hydroxy-6-metoxy-1,4-benzoquinol methylase